MSRETIIETMRQYKIPTGLVTAGEEFFPDLGRMYQQALFTQRENSGYAAGRRLEKVLMEGVASGNTKLIHSIISRMDQITTVGDLSSSSVRSLRYYTVALITQVTRAAIDGGMPETEAYALSDALIYKLDTLDDCGQISRLSALALQEFTRRMARFRQHRYSPPVTKCCRHISSHLNEPVSLSDLARVCGLSAGYLSVLFREETGISAKQYILREKLSAAQDLLAHTDLTVQQIAETFFFASSSHFSSAFKRQYGITPTQWRTARE